MNEYRTDTPSEENLPKFRGVYRHVKISVKALDIIIVACIAVIPIVFALEMRNPGFTVTFDSTGGTDVPAQNQMYEELRELPQPPTREGYTFMGWYKYPACDIPWDIETDIVESDMALYAGWQKKQ